MRPRLPFNTPVRGSHCPLALRPRTARPFFNPAIARLAAVAEGLDARMMATAQFGAGGTTAPVIFTVNGNQGPGGGTLNVTLVQGTFPVPTASLVWYVVINPNTQSILDGATTERFQIDGYSGSGPNYTLTFTSGTLANAHVSGEYVALIVTGDELNGFLQQTGQFGGGGNFTGPIDMGGHKIVDGAAGSASSDVAIVGQLPSAVPDISSMIAVGHSYLGSVGFGVDEPMTQAIALMPHLLGMFHVPDDNFHDMTTAGGFLVGNGGPTLSAWDAVLQRVLPAQATGLVASPATGKLFGSFPTEFPSIGQPPAIILTGVNDVGTALPMQATVVGSPPARGIGFSYTAATFTGSISGAGATSITSSTNLTVGSALLNGRGIQVGDFIWGATGLNGVALVLAISWNGSNLTTITVPASSTTATETNETFYVLDGQFAQFALAAQHSYEAIITRLIAGSVVRSDDTNSSTNLSYFTYTNGSGGGGSWTNPTQKDNVYGPVGHSGPTVAQVTTTPGATVNPKFTLTLPLNFPGGLVAIMLIGTGDADYNGSTAQASYVAWSGTSAASGAPNTLIGNQGWAGFSAPVVARFVLTAADAGKTIVGTFHATTSTATLQVDNASFDATYQSLVLLGNQPPALTLAGPIQAAAIDWAITKAIYTFTNTNSGSGINQCGVQNNYGQIAKADLWGAIAKGSFWLGSNLPSAAQNAVTASVTLVGQRSVAQGDQVAPYVNQPLGMACPTPGGLGEYMVITAVASAGNVSIGGTNYPSWTVSLRRATNIIESQTGLAATGSIGHYTGASIDVTTLSGSSLAYTADEGSFASAGNVLVYTTYNGVPTRAVISYTGISGGNLTGCNLISGGGTLTTNGIAVQTAITDASWNAADLGHPNQPGSARLASVFYQQMLAVFNSSADVQAAANQSWTQRRTRTSRRPPFHGYWQNKGITGSGTLNIPTTAYAIPFYTPELVIVEDISVYLVAVSTAATHQLMYAGIAIPAAGGGSYPGEIVTDFGLSASTSAYSGSPIGGLDLNSGASAGAWNVIAAGYQLLPPGEYWIIVGTGSAGSGQATFRPLARTHGVLDGYLDVANALNQTLTNLNPQTANMPGGTSTATGVAGWSAAYPSGNLSGNALVNLLPLNSNQNPYGDISGAPSSVGQWNAQQALPMIAVHILGHSYSTLP